jgi:hypothetical protein
MGYQVCVEYPRPEEFEHIMKTSEEARANRMRLDIETFDSICREEDTRMRFHDAVSNNRVLRLRDTISNPIECLPYHSDLKNNRELTERLHLRPEHFSSSVDGRGYELVYRDITTREVVIATVVAGDASSATVPPKSSSWIRSKAESLEKEGNGNRSAPSVKLAEEVRKGMENGHVRQLFVQVTPKEGEYGEKRFLMSVSESLPGKTPDGDVRFQVVARNLDVFEHDHPHPDSERWRQVFGAPPKEGAKQDGLQSRSEAGLNVIGSQPKTEAKGLAEANRSKEKIADSKGRSDGRPQPTAKPAERRIAGGRDDRPVGAKPEAGTKTTEKVMEKGVSPVPTQQREASVSKPQASSETRRVEERSAGGGTKPQPIHQVSAKPSSKAEEGSGGKGGITIVPGSVGYLTGAERNLYSKKAADHAFEKHRLGATTDKHGKDLGIHGKLEDFPGSPMRTKELMAKEVRRILREPTDWKALRNDRVIYYDAQLDAVVIINKRNPDQSSFYQPSQGVVKNGKPVLDANGRQKIRFGREYFDAQT